MSEIILQQTRVAQGLPYFQKFIETFPTISDLANSEEEKVLRLWQGLGYYSRARNLHACAKEICEVHQGRFPDSYLELLHLKGVGSYTAAAIASFAYDEAVAVVDGNVFRVLSRFFGIATDIASTSGKKEFEALANSLIPHDKPGEFNQAMMEFGALQCVPKNPDCSICPVRGACFAFKNDLIGNLPVKIKKLKVKERHFTYYMISCDESIVVKQRGSGDIWQGLYDFPLMENENSDFSSEKPLIQAELEKIVTATVTNLQKQYKHLLTHQRIFANFVIIEVKDSDKNKLVRLAQMKDYQLVSLHQFEQMPKPRLILKFLEDRQDSVN